ncbi:uncharacterized protein E5676_scaffold447G00220 [Cucumis melo var. makuwa]|uniref:RNA-directed DNA polymerase-like protein n=1 Tax=Cucumis melo var. makuwa TaxID=1194695 RepID=A0A5A7SKQ9_CUCMM|nr:uncharacterized protein E6C27_scaffold34G00900 [Cucumis melo var. makuwa]TYK09627.1 uncharacterized protein E5676_scaffold447G00220 [Cucumis melo var. makuwa]
MSVMVTDLDTSEDRMKEFEKKVNMLIKEVEERDYKIASLKNHIESGDADESSHTHIFKNGDKGKEVNLGMIKEPHPTFISAQLSDDDENDNQTKASANQASPMTISTRLISQIKEEVNKLIEVEFIREVKYPTWIDNIILLRKKNGQLCIFIDFRNLSNAYLKDDFPLHIMEIMVDATVWHETLSFMDGPSGYNQIRMALDDEEKTTFRTPKVKSKKKYDHRKDLKLVLDCLKKYQLRMNSLKCAFDVTSGKFLEFIVRHVGIEVHHSTIDAI